MEHIKEIGLPVSSKAETIEFESLIETILITELVVKIVLLLVDATIATVSSEYLSASLLQTPWPLLKVD